MLKLGNATLTSGIEKFPENSLKVEKSAHSTCFVFFDMDITEDSICKQCFPGYCP